MFTRLAQSSTERGWLKNNADMLDQGSLLVSNSVILASEISYSIPRVYARCARTLLGFTGIISIHFQFRDLMKLTRDLYLAGQGLDWSAMGYTAAKTAVKAVDIILIIGGFVTAALTLAGRPSFAARYYRKAIPIATISWFALIAFDLIDSIRNRALLKKMESLKVARQEELCHSFQEALAYGKCSYLARELLRQLDNYRLNGLEQTGITFATLLSNVKEAVLLNQADISLKAYGYICLGINSRYPETAIQALTTWSSSVLYTYKLVYSKYFAAR